MKRGLVLVLAAAFVLGFATCASASYSFSLGIPVAFEYYESGSFSGETATGFSVGAEATLGESFRLGLGYLSVHEDPGDSFASYSNFTGTFTYRPLKGDRFTLDLFASYGAIEIYTLHRPGNYLALGAGAAFAISDNWSINASLASSIDGRLSYGGGYDEMGVFAYSVGLTYMFTESFALSLDYSCDSYDVPGSEFGFRGFTAGLDLNF